MPAHTPHTPPAHHIHHRHRHAHRHYQAHISEHIHSYMHDRTLAPNTQHATNPATTDRRNATPTAVVFAPAPIAARAACVGQRTPEATHGCSPYHHHIHCPSASSITLPCNGRAPQQHAAIALRGATSLLFVHTPSHTLRGAPQPPPPRRNSLRLLWMSAMMLAMAARARQRRLAGEWCHERIGIAARLVRACCAATCGRGTA